MVVAAQAATALMPTKKNITVLAERKSTRVALSAATISSNK
jgi:hypothetical protein